ncbi:hypothetical protein LSAT2_011760 [Lamellibrachia satsuma]|nr:hypothetical protein LSAT2_011760 [Lamellibrachia satsuma]
MPTRPCQTTDDRIADVIPTQHRYVYVLSSNSESLCTIMNITGARKTAHIDVEVDLQVVNNAFLRHKLLSLTMSNQSDDVLVKVRELDRLGDCKPIDNENDVRNTYVLPRLHNVKKPTLKIPTFCQCGYDFIQSVLGIQILRQRMQGQATNAQSTHISPTCSESGNGDLEY